MTLKQIKTASLSELHNAAAKTILAQGEGRNYSKMLENRLIAINKQIEKRKLDALVTKKKPVFKAKGDAPIQPNQRLMPIENYIHHN